MLQLLTYLYVKLKGGEIMMAMLWAQQIMLKETVEEAKAMYAKVPRLLVEQVKQILIDSEMDLSVINQEIKKSMKG